MKLSSPIFKLKRRARLLSRKNGIPLNEALDQIARDEGFPRWSSLSARMAVELPRDSLLSRLTHGDMLLLAGRPGHGKTRMGLRLLLDAARADRAAILFTLELTQQQAHKHFQILQDDVAGDAEQPDVVTSPEISADYIIRYMSGMKPGAIAVIDYLQILDQQRSKPALCEQMFALSDFARRTGTIFGFLSQIDRSFDAQGKRLPDLEDIRLPNALDLGLFTKACFMHDRDFQLRAFT
jgi:replicative DNA helicase